MKNRCDSPLISNTRNIYMKLKPMTQGQSSTHKGGKTFRRGFLALSLAAAIIIILSVIYPTFFQAESASKAPKFTLTDVDGQRFSLSDYRGRPILLQFMATWCPSCNIEVDRLKEIQRRYGEEVAIISIGVDPTESDKRLKEFSEKRGAQWRFARDTMALTQRYGVTSIPTIVMIDREGYIRFVNTESLMPLSRMREEIDKLLLS